MNYRPAASPSLRNHLPATLRSKWSTLFAIHCAILCVLAGFSSYALTAATRPDAVLRPLCFLAMALLIWMLVSWKLLTGSLFDPYSLFVFAAAMFHTGQMALECFHLNPDGMLSNMFPPGILMQAIVLVLLSFGFLHVGALAGWRLFRARKNQPAPERQGASGSPFVSEFIRMFGWALFAVSFVPAVIDLKRTVSATLAGGYFYALFARPGATGFSGILTFLATFLIPATFFLLAGSAPPRPSRLSFLPDRHRLTILISAVVMVCYSVVFLFIGGRTVAAISSAVYAWLFDRLIRPIPRSLIATMVLLGLLVVFPLIALTRNAGGSDRLSLDYLEQSWSSLEHPAAASLDETGGSLMTVCYTLELVPTLRDFDKGTSYAMALFTLVPNLFWDIHPSVAYGTPANWMLSIVNPHLASVGGGLGYSLIAEAYFNFGWCAPLFIALLGVLLGWLVCWVGSTQDPLRYVCTANILVPLLWYTRNESSGAFRDIFWLGVGPYLLIRLASTVAGQSYRNRLLAPVPLVHRLSQKHRPTINQT